jgi:hypothetical protein
VRAHLTWFAAVFAAGVISLIVIPPFQIDGEAAHWARLHSLTGCGPVPLRVVAFADATGHQAVRGGMHFRFGNFDAALRATAEKPAKLSGELARACGTAPTAYLVPALGARLAELFWPLEHGRTLMGYYGARFAAWLLLSAAALLLLHAAPQARAFTLFAYSLVIFRGVAVHPQATLFALAAVALAAQSLRVRWQRVAATALPLILIVTAWPAASPRSLQIAPSYFIVTCAGLLALLSDLGSARWPRAHKLMALGAGALMLVAWATAIGQLRALYFERLSS